MKKSSFVFAVGFFFLSSTAGDPPKEELLNKYDKQLKKFLSNKAPVLLVALRNRSPIDEPLSEGDYSELEPIRVLIDCYNTGLKDQIGPWIITEFKNDAKRLGVELPQ